MQSLIPLFLAVRARGQAIPAALNRHRSWACRSYLAGLQDRQLCVRVGFASFHGALLKLLAALDAGWHRPAVFVLLLWRGNMVRVHILAPGMVSFFGIREGISYVHRGLLRIFNIPRLA